MNKNVFGRGKMIDWAKSFIPFFQEVPDTYTEIKETKPMCNDCGCENVSPLLAHLIRKELKKKLDNDTPFSAWDITKLIRCEVGPDVLISHGDVRAVVKATLVEKSSKFSDDGMYSIDGHQWVRTLIELHNGKVTYVYHPLTVMAEVYPGFAKLVPTMNTTKISDAPKADALDYEAVYESLYEIADCFRDDVDCFLDGQTNLEDLRKSMDDFDTAVEEIQKELE